MVQGLKDLLSSEHGLFGIVIMICATVLVGLGRMTTDQWVGVSEWIFTAYAGAHGLVAVAGAIKAKSENALPPAPAVINTVAPTTVEVSK